MTGAGITVAMATEGVAAVAIAGAERPVETRVRRPRQRGTRTPRVDDDQERTALAVGVMPRQGVEAQYPGRAACGSTDARQRCTDATPQEAR
jgi:hypothetical protein